MNNAQIPGDIAFTNSDKAIQYRKGSRRAYANMENGVGWATSMRVKFWGTASVIDDVQS